MSGPIVPPLEVTEVDGSPDGRPITKIIVSNGDLSISGRTATIDTSGSATTPGGATTNVQYNNAGAFGGAADFIFTGIGGTDPKLSITNSAGDVGSLSQVNLTFDGGTSLPAIGTTNGDDGLLIATGTHGINGPRILLDAVTSPSNLGLFNAESNGTINIETSVGTGDITIDSNGDLHLKADLTIDARVLTTASFTSSATDNDMNFNVIANGAGTPLINLKNDTKEVRLTCEEDDILYVRGPTSGERFTFDASSATGGITWPDGTEQITAASGGGGGWIAIPTLTSATYGTYDLSVAAPYGVARRSTDSLDDEPCFAPFYSPESGTLAAITIGVSSAAGSACNALIGIYNQSAGIPTTKIAECALDVTSTGDVRQTSFTGTPTLVKDTLYFAGYCKSELVAVTLRSADSVYGPGAGPTNSTEDQKVNLELGSSSKVLPASVTEANLQTTNTETPAILLEW